MMQVMNEIWKQYKDTNYEVSNLGNVRNIKTKRMLKPWKDLDDYLVVGFYVRKGKVKKYKVHRLVAETFIPNYDNLPCVNHKNENKQNNCVDNLEWCTHEYNNIYGTRIERMVKAKSKTVLQLRKDGSLVRVWSSVNEIYRKLGYFYGNINQCCLGKRHSAYGFKWCYAKQ